MDKTYILICKMEYQDLIESYVYEDYELIDFSYSIKDIQLKMGFIQQKLELSLNNIFNDKGVLNAYDLKMIPLDGKYNREQLSIIGNKLKDMIFNNQKKSL